VRAALVARWSQPHRHYHTLDHLAQVLSIVDAHAALADDAEAVRLAAWFHDAVYDPRATDNEERSAALAVATLAPLGVPAARVAEVARLVRLTAGHAVPDGDRNGALLADADLPIPPAPPEAYHPQPRLYRIVPDRAERTGRATANLRRELALLTA
jgi:predicted metal-dependent HD superfamily phosphohydrolase